MSEATNSNDYQETLQQSALGFLRRHEAQYLNDSQSLFNRAVQALQRVHNAPRQMAENCVARAYGELRGRGDNPHLEISLSTAYSAVLVDPSSGMHFVVPVSTIVEHIVKRRHPNIRAVQ